MSKQIESKALAISSFIEIELVPYQHRSRWDWQSRPNKLSAHHSAIMKLVKSAMYLDKSVALALCHSEAMEFMSMAETQTNQYVSRDGIL